MIFGFLLDTPAFNQIIWRENPSIQPWIFIPYLESLSYSSICQTEFGPLLEYTRLLSLLFFLYSIPSGYIIWSNPRTVSWSTTNPLSRHFKCNQRYSCIWPCISHCSSTNKAICMISLLYFRR